jgi:hypothetical protein
MRILKIVLVALVAMVAGTFIGGYYDGRSGV